MKRRVVITGIGVIAPNGIGKENFWNALKEGKSGIKKISLFDASELPVQIAGEVSNFRPEEFIEDRKKIRRMARFSQFAVAAAKMAIEDAGLNLQNGKNIGIFIGTSTSAMDLIEKEFLKLIKYKGRNIIPYGIVSASPTAAALKIKDFFRIKVSEASTNISDCRGGLEAICEGVEKILNNEVDICLCGGVDACLTPLIYTGFFNMGLLCKINNPEKASRPFDKLRDGGVISEGCGVVILESYENAKMRKARIYGEIYGYGKYFENNEENLENGLYNSMKIALEKSNLKEESIDYISAHAPSDPELDRGETIAIEKLFGKRAYFIPVSSIKSMIGNPLAAGGILQLISSLMTINTGIIPPTINYEYPDPDCDLDYVPNCSRYMKVEKILINSHSFGQANTSLVIGKTK